MASSEQFSGSQGGFLALQRLAGRPLLDLRPTD
jgi:hypothetical protein